MPSCLASRLSPADRAGRSGVRRGGEGGEVLEAPPAGCVPRGCQGFAGLLPLCPMGLSACREGHSLGGWLPACKHLLVVFGGVCGGVWALPWW